MSDEPSEPTASPTSTPATESQLPPPLIPFGTTSRLTIVQVGAKRTHAVAEITEIAGVPTVVRVLSVEGAVGLGRAMLTAAAEANNRNRPAILLARPRGRN